MKSRFAGITIRFLRYFIPVVLTIIIVYSLHIAFANYFVGDQEAFLFVPEYASSCSPFSLRAVVRKHSDNTPIQGALITIEAQKKSSKKLLLFSGRTDFHGISEITLNLPKDIDEKDINLLITIQSSFGKDVFRKTIPVKYPIRLDLASDKSDYNPGDMIYLQAVIVGQNDSKPVQSRNIELSVISPEGDVIFRKSGKTSTYGIFQASFRLADTKETGDYTIMANSSDDNLVKKVRISKPVAFSLNIETEKHFCLQGQEVKGKVTVKNIAGVPVKKASVNLDLWVRSENPKLPLAHITALTDDAGVLPFKCRLPDNTASSSNAEEPPVLVAFVEASDKLGGFESIKKCFVIAQKPMVITCLPQNGGIVPGLRNMVYILTSYQDGTPAKTNLKIKTGNKLIKVDSDEFGISKMMFDPAKESAGVLEIKARDKEGNQMETSFEISTLVGRNTFSLLTDRVLYSQGDLIKAKISTLSKSGFIFLDLVTDKKVLLSKVIKIESEMTEAEALIPEMFSGFAQLQATMINSDGGFEKLFQSIFVAPAQKLKLSLHRSESKSKQDKTGRVTVECSGQGSREAAISIVIADEMPDSVRDKFIGFSRFGGIFSDILEKDESPDSNQKVLPFSGTIVKSIRELIFNNRLDIGLLSLQDRARLAFLSLRDRDEILSVNLYAHKIKSNQERRHQYFFRLVLYFIRFTFIFILICFLLILGLTLMHIYLKSKDEKRFLLIRNNEEVISILIFLLGFFLLLLGPMMFALPLSFFSNMGITELHKSSLFQLFLALEIFLMFIYILALWRNVKVRPIRKMNTMRYTFIILQCYIGALIIVISTIFTSSLTRWNLELILSLNAPYAILSILSLCALPFVLLYSTLSHLIRPRRSPMRKLVFYLTSGIIVVAIISSVYLVFDYNTNVIQKNRKSIFARKTSYDKEIPVEELNDKTIRKSSIFAENARNYIKGVLFCNSELSADNDENILISFPLPYSVNKLKVSANAIDEQGNTGSLEKTIKYNCGFNLSIVSPDSLTIGDEISVPVCVSNSNKEEKKVRLDVSSDGGILIKSPGSIYHSIPGEREYVFFVHLKAIIPGQENITVNLETDNGNEVCEKKIEVLSLGEKISISKSGWIKNDVTVPVDISGGAIKKTGNIIVKIYPGIISTVFDAAKAIMMSPDGTFEDVVSSAYPVAMLSASVKKMPQLKEYVGFIDENVNIGYQRILDFQMPPGGFTFFNRKNNSNLYNNSGYNCSIWLTAYALSCLSEMAKTYPVDLKTIHEAAIWLAREQKSDGSWEESARTTAFVVNALISAGQNNDPCIQKALDYLKNVLRKDTDTYTLALCSLIFVQRIDDKDFTARLLDRIRKDVVAEGDKLYWVGGAGTLSTVAGKSADVETTALCVRVLLRSGQFNDMVRRALSFLMESKDFHGLWQSNLASVETVKTLLLAREHFKEDHCGNIAITMNEKPLECIKLSQYDDGKVRLIKPKGEITPGRYEFKISEKENSFTSYQINCSYNIPQKLASKADKTGGLSFRAGFDKKSVKVGSKVTCLLSMKNGSERDMNMLVARMGIPAGFQVVEDDLLDLQSNKRIKSFKLENNVLYLYFNGLAREEERNLSFTLKSIYPVNLTLPLSCIYEFNNPVERFFAQSVRISSKR